ncbi:uncharacterized protein LOC110826930 isoform X2 [Zootermopsis nevadensis]|uniref:uncharacterized protein LOC110826930 isoform X2 n=1 Tax=Zootermopsis nevadensis TaxID=136037 RepID=UPI000B8EC551|nr:uncharacterized protein LOC110826930 isoform X2 [Zootermopsis nevadensis]
MFRKERNNEKNLSRRWWQFFCTKKATAKSDIRVRPAMRKTSNKNELPLNNMVECHSATITSVELQQWKEVLKQAERSKEKDRKERGSSLLIICREWYT